MAADFRPVAPVDPTNLRPMLFLDAARQMMLSPDWGGYVCGPPAPESVVARDGPRCAAQG